MCFNETSAFAADQQGASPLMTRKFSGLQLICSILSRSTVYQGGHYRVRHRASMRLQSSLQINTLMSWIVPLSKRNFNETAACAADQSGWAVIHGAEEHASLKRRWRINRHARTTGSSVVLTAHPKTPRACHPPCSVVFGHGLIEARGPRSSGEDTGAIFVVLSHDLVEARSRDARSRTGAATLRGIEPRPH